MARHTHDLKHLFPIIHEDYNLCQRNIGFPRYVLKGLQGTKMSQKTNQHWTYLEHYDCKWLETGIMINLKFCLEMRNRSPSVYFQGVNRQHATLTREFDTDERCYVGGYILRTTAVVLEVAGSATA